MNLVEKIEQARIVVDRVMKMFEENADAFEQHDLKLHDAIYYAWDNLKKDFPLTAQKTDEQDLFYTFCQISYEDMLIDLEECYNIDFEKSVQYIGRTSRFYLYDDNDLAPSKDYWLGVLAESLYGGDIYFINKDNKLDIPAGIENLIEYGCEFNEIENIVNDILDYLIEDFEQDVMNRFDSTIKMHEYIEKFKQNQVDNFKDFVEINYEDELKAEQESIEDELKISKASIERFKEVYDVLEDDFSKLEETILNISRLKQEQIIVE